MRDEFPDHDVLAAAREFLRVHVRNQVSLNPYSTLAYRNLWDRGFLGEEVDYCGFPCTEDRGWRVGAFTKILYDLQFGTFEADIQGD